MTEFRKPHTNRRNIEMQGLSDLEKCVSERVHVNVDDVRNVNQ